MSAVRAIAGCDLAHSPSQSIIQKPISARDNRTNERVKIYTNINGMSEQTKRIAQQKFHLLYSLSLSLTLYVLFFADFAQFHRFFFSVHFHFVFSMSILNVLMVAQFTLSLYAIFFFISFSLFSASILFSSKNMLGPFLVGDYFVTEVWNTRTFCCNVDACNDAFTITISKTTALVPATLIATLYASTIMFRRQ